MGRAEGRAGRGCHSGWLGTVLKQAAHRLAAQKLSTLQGINAIVAHATARSFRARELDHWEPLDGDPIEFVKETEAK